MELGDRTSSHLNNLLNNLPFLPSIARYVTFEVILVTHNP